MGDKPTRNDFFDSTETLKHTSDNNVETIHQLQSNCSDLPEFHLRKQNETVEQVNNNLTTSASRSKYQPHGYLSEDTFAKKITDGTNLKEETNGNNHHEVHEGDVSKSIRSACSKPNNGELLSNCKNVLSKLENKLLPGLNSEKGDKMIECTIEDKIDTNKKRQTHLSVEYMDPDTVSGIGKFQPQWLQKYATARCYLIIYSIVGVLQGSYFTYLIGTMTTLEKRYSFKSKISGTIMMIDELTPLILGIPLGYFGGRMHRPRILALGMFLSALCCFLSALPYFLYGTAHDFISTAIKNETGMEYCDIHQNKSSCDEDSLPPTMAAVACLILGSFLKGFGNIAYYAIGLSYMDDNAKKKNTPMYFAISESLRMSGPLIGFLMSSAFLNYYENPFGDPGYGPEDPRWIGAWWIGFVVQGVLIAVTSLPLLLFPRRLPKQKLRALSNTQNFELESNWQRITGMTKALKRLLTNPMYMMLVLGTVFTIIGEFGLIVLLPKYMEIQFRLSASDANLYSGPPAILGMQITMLLGGWLIWKLLPSVKQLLSCQALVEFVWALGILLLMIPSCDHLELRGTTLTENGLEVQNICNMDCSCSTRSYSPVCGPDGISTYFSPCHAGCKTASSSNSTDIIGNCTCLYDENNMLINNTSSTIKNGLCESESCWTQAIIYIVLLPIFSAATSIVIVAHTMILLRCVDPQDKSVALGLFESLVCLFGFVPQPIIFGALADSVCLVWENTCGTIGNCWFYDVDQFKYLVHGTAATFCIASTICFATLYFMSNRVRDLYKEEDEN